MKLLFFAALFLVFAIEVAATGIGAAPAELQFSVEKGRRQQKELTLYNLDERSIEFEVRSGSGFLEFYHNGTAEPLGAEKIIVEANAEKLKEGTHTGTVYITTAGNPGGVALSIGAAIKVTVSVFSRNKTSFLTGVMTTFLIVAAGLAIYYSSARAHRAIASAWRG